jgi:hypothetical protein
MQPRWQHTLTWPSAYSFRSAVPPTLRADSPGRDSRDPKVRALDPKGQQVARISVSDPDRDASAVGGVERVNRPVGQGVAREVY